MPRTQILVPQPNRNLWGNPVPATQLADNLQVNENIFVKLTSGSFGSSTIAWDGEKMTFNITSLCSFFVYYQKVNGRPIIFDSEDQIKLRAKTGASAVTGSATGFQVQYDIFHTDSTLFARNVLVAPITANRRPTDASITNSFLTDQNGIAPLIQFQGNVGGGANLLGTFVAQDFELYQSN